MKKTTTAITTTTITTITTFCVDSGLDSSETAEDDGPVTSLDGVDGLVDADGRQSGPDQQLGTRTARPRQETTRSFI